MNLPKKREQKMEWQMRAYITKNNSKQETLKRELMSLKKQLDLTVKQKQEIQKGLTSIKLEYKDKETKLLNDFSKLKMLKKLKQRRRNKELRLLLGNLREVELRAKWFNSIEELHYFYVDTLQRGKKYKGRIFYFI